MENEQEKQSPESNYSTFELDEVGEFRAKKGTATHELAGAAVYWQRECKTIEARYNAWSLKALRSKFWDGFLTGAISATLIAATAVLIFNLTRNHAQENREQGKESRQVSQEARGGR